jgi:hypothetical protein
MADPPKRGRPPLTPGQTPVRVEVLVPTTQYDRAYSRARQEGVSVPALLRRALRRELGADDADDE